MAENVAIKRNLAEAVTKLVDSLHNKYSGIKIRPISNYEDEDFTVEIIIPEALSLDKVEEEVHKECIKAEDEYDLYIFPKVIYENRVKNAGRISEE